MSQNMPFKDSSSRDTSSTNDVLSVKDTPSAHDASSINAHAQAPEHKFEILELENFEPLRDYRDKLRELVRENKLNDAQELNSKFLQWRKEYLALAPQDRTEEHYGCDPVLLQHMLGVAAGDLILSKTYAGSWKCKRNVDASCELVLVFDSNNKRLVVAIMDEIKLAFESDVTKGIVTICMAVEKTLERIR